MISATNSLCDLCVSKCEPEVTISHGYQSRVTRRVAKSPVEMRAVGAHIAKEVIKFQFSKLRGIFQLPLFNNQIHDITVQSAVIKYVAVVVVGMNFSVRRDTDFHYASPLLQHEGRRGSSAENGTFNSSRRRELIIISLTGCNSEQSLGANYRPREVQAPRRREEAQASLFLEAAE